MSQLFGIAYSLLTLIATLATDTLLFYLMSANAVTFTVYIYLVLQNIKKKTSVFIGGGGGAAFFE